MRAAGSRQWDCAGSCSGETVACSEGRAHSAAAVESKDMVASEMCTGQEKKDREGKQRGGCRACTEVLVERKRRSRAVG